MNGCNKGIMTTIPRELLPRAIKRVWSPTSQKNAVWVSPEGRTADPASPESLTQRQRCLLFSIQHAGATYKADPRFAPSSTMALSKRHALAQNMMLAGAHLSRGHLCSWRRRSRHTRRRAVDLAKLALEAGALAAAALAAPAAQACPPPPAQVLVPALALPFLALAPGAQVAGLHSHRPQT